MENQPKNKSSAVKAGDKQKTGTIIGLVLCVLLIPILVLNCILIVKSWVHKDEIPSISGRMPLIVLSASMEPEIKKGDVIVCKEIDGKDVGVDCVIAFFDPASRNNSVVTHRVTDVKEENGVLYFQTKGDNNNAYDSVWVPETAIIGAWTGFRVPLVGHVALFMQTTGGLLVCILVPLALFIGYDILRKKKSNQATQEDVEALKRELELLKAAKRANDETAEK